MKKLTISIFSLFVSCSALSQQETRITYSGQPPPSAIAPSISSSGQDLCAVPITGSVSTTIVGIAGGSVITDVNCERIKLSRVLNDVGLKVSAVAVLCQDKRVWQAMEMSGSPCPIGGSIGDQARSAWYKLKPDWYQELYGKNFKLEEPAPATSNSDSK